MTIQDKRIRNNTKRIPITTDYFYKEVDKQLEKEGFTPIKKEDSAYSISEIFRAGSGFPVLTNTTHLAIICQNSNVYPNSNSYDYCVKTLELSKIK
jgi:hypothetical protein